MSMVSTRVRYFIIMLLSESCFRNAFHGIQTVKAYRKVPRRTSFGGSPINSSVVPEHINNCVLFGQAHTGLTF